MDFLRLTGGEVLAGKGVYDREGIIADILGDKNKLVGVLIPRHLSVKHFPSLRFH